MGASAEGGQIPAQIADYRIESELGRGGMGAVFVAQHVHLGRRVALKVILDGDPSPRALGRFDIEAKAMAKLSHPNIIRVQDAGVFEGRRYLVMDLVEGKSLSERIKRGGVLGEHEAARLTETLARAMSHAHSQGVLHRDLKPDNVLLDTRGEPLIIDFGLARDAAQEKQRLTQTGQMLGTPHYMSPEQADGDKARIDALSDVYSLGATLYAMLSGGPPFEGGSAIAVIRSVLSLPPPSLSKSRGERVDPGLEAICLRCLEKEPQERYASCADLAEALDRWANPGAGASSGGVAGKLLTAGLALFVLGAGFAGIVSIREPASSPSASESPEPPPTSKTASGDPPLDRDAQLLASAPAWYAKREARPSLPLPAGVRFGDQAGEYVSERDGSVLVWVPPGEFLMGRPDDDLLPARRRGLPAHRVRITKGYFIGKYEVTWGQFVEFCTATSRSAEQEIGLKGEWPEWVTSRHPMWRMHWNLAQEYCAWAGLRLPSEAEWEFAARGSDGRAYPWGNEPPRPHLALANIGDFDRGRKTDADGFRRIAPVGRFSAGASPFGCQDMAGNLWEWVEDRGGPYSSESAVDPTGPSTGAARVLRGGSCNDSGATVRSTSRIQYAPGTLNGDFGFRVARDGR
jgi:serine/threonine protein kinase/formylglycine-generating enzyme required for sulfatase activity